MSAGLAAAGLAASLLLGPVPATAADPLDDLATALEQTDVTDAMLDDAVLDLTASAREAVLPLVTDGAVNGLEREPQEDQGSQVVLTSDLLFAFGSAELSPAATAALGEIAARVPDGAAVSVDGHTDSRGGDDVNIPLSQARAQAVADVLAGSRPDLVLTVTGHGSSAPVAENETDGVDNPSGRALNRRVELSWPG